MNGKKLYLYEIKAYINIFIPTHLHFIYDSPENHYNSSYHHNYYYDDDTFTTEKIRKKILYKICLLKFTVK